MDKIIMWLYVAAALAVGIFIEEVEMPVDNDHGTVPERNTK